MEQHALQQVEQLALKKEKTFSENPFHYVFRAILASLFIGFGVIVAFRTGNLFYLEGSPFTYPIAAITFGAAIILIAFGGGDLFTGNAFYYTYTCLRKKMVWSSALKLLSISYVGNLIGAIVFALIIFFTGLFNDPSVNSFLFSVVGGKMNAPWMELFFRGILCNWLVCLAFFLPMNMKSEGAKIFTMMLLVFCFFISGYEHSIANLGAFAISLVLDHPETISFGGAIHNLIPVTIGNFIGGSLFMGVFYYYLNHSKQVETQTELKEYALMRKEMN
ncbi:formate/nitrite transporter family protein [Alkalihalobacillus sp. MEB130]|uniref:formate/nitrite transporter family protein n=1 Tax=Alkalihalobacillus sp. MEB130 TaxID=2976704 RepID=UPI0028DD58ED|nr:formate/nitrite transporter family protein [Alkalihalobacillus sp. MEB130]MDT8860180.1 formate/nitrite transporter family protein [Alkalihalobacillus sp. MEB130]